MVNIRPRKEQMTKKKMTYKAWIGAWFLTLWVENNCLGNEIAKALRLNHILP